MIVVVVLVVFTLKTIPVSSLFSTSFCFNINLCTHPVDGRLNPYETLLTFFEGTLHHGIVDGCVSAGLTRLCVERPARLLRLAE